MSKISNIKNTAEKKLSADRQEHNRLLKELASEIIALEKGDEIPEGKCYHTIRKIDEELCRLRAALSADQMVLLYANSNFIGRFLVKMIVKRLGY